MTIAEAIEKEIAREKAELAGLEAEENRLWAALEKAATEEARRQVAEQLVRVMNMILRRAEYEQEIEGKKVALAAANADPEDPIGAIETELANEEVKAADHARKAQALREQAWRDQQEGKLDNAKKARAEAKKLSDEFDLELARIRGKRQALRAAKRAKAEK
jgi:hypothetical protein